MPKVPRQKTGSDIQLLILFRGEPMFTANETELIDYAANKVIVSFKIIEEKSGKFNLSFTLSWKKDGDCMLISARKDLRKWASLNTLLTFIKGLNVPDVPISIQPFYNGKRSKK